MKRFTIVHALLSLPFIAGVCTTAIITTTIVRTPPTATTAPIGMTILHIRNILAQNLSRECRTAATIGTKPKKYLRALLEQSVSRASVGKSENRRSDFRFWFL